MTVMAMAAAARKHNGSSYGSYLIVTSKPREIQDILRDLTELVKQKSDELKSLAGNKDHLPQMIVLAVDLKEAALTAERYADRAMSLENEIDFERLDKKQ